MRTAMKIVGMFCGFQFVGQQITWILSIGWNVNGERHIVVVIVVLSPFPPVAFD